MSIDVPALRKMVEWVETESTLAPTFENERDWSQGNWFISNERKAHFIANEIMHQYEGSCPSSRWDWDDDQTPAEQNAFHDWRRKHSQIKEVVRHTCGTAGCLAGQTVLTMGTEQDIAVMHRESSYAETLAERILGIQDMNHSLFNASNTAADIRFKASELVKRYTEEEL